MIRFLWPTLLITLISTLFACTAQRPTSHRSYSRYVAATQIGSKTSCAERKESLKWGVVIGVNFYQDERIPDLNGAVDDAWNFYHYLVNPQGAKLDPSRVQLLLNEEATRQAVDKALGQFITRSCPQDQVFIYFAGHGAPEPGRPDEAFLLLHDTRLNSLVSTAVSMSQLPNFLKWRTGETAQLLMMIDACHSGNLQFPNQRGFQMTSLNEAEVAKIDELHNSQLNETITKMIASQKGWGAISATAAKELAIEGDRSCQLAGQEYRGGLFTCALLNSFNGSADLDRNGKLSYDEVFNFIREDVEHRSPKQTPQRSGSMSGKLDLFPTINQRLELPKIPLQYLSQNHPKPYRPWLYTSLGLTSATLLSGGIINILANQSVNRLNRYNLTVSYQSAGERGFSTLKEEYEGQKSLSKQLYLSSAIFGVILSGLFALDQSLLPEGRNDVYQRGPRYVMTGEAP